MGIAPLWISDLILDSLQPIVDKLVIAAN